MWGGLRPPPWSCCLFVGSLLDPLYACVNLRSRCKVLVICDAVNWVISASTNSFITNKNISIVFIFDKINDYLNKKTTLVLNGNDGISGLLGEGICDRVFYSVSKTERSTDTCVDTVCDLIACPKCNHKLDYEFYHYNHIGVPKCLNCGFKMPESRFFASDVDFENSTFVFNCDKGESLVLPYQKGNFFNVFNITGACAICRLMGIDI